MIHHLTKYHEREIRRGFALIATVSIMALLVMIALGMLSLSKVELRSSRHGDAMSQARANARMALMLAIGELQKSAGPDQRVTATADILGGNSTAAAGHAHWTGVWDTTDYDPSDPDTKPFVGWLVSSADSTINSNKSSASLAAATDDVLIFEGVDDASSVKVPKVAVTGTTNNSQYYAYWVEDEGVKADLAWNEGEFTDVQREQAARLSASPGVDYEVFKGPFSGEVAHPIAKKGSNSWHSNLNKSLKWYRLRC